MVRQIRQPTLHNPSWSSNRGFMQDLQDTSLSAGVHKGAGEDFTIIDDVTDDAND